MIPNQWYAVVESGDVKPGTLERRSPSHPCYHQGEDVMNTKRNCLSTLCIALAMTVVTSLLAVMGLRAGSPAYAMPANAPALDPLLAGPQSSPQGANADLPLLGSWIFVVNGISSNMSVINAGTGVVYGPMLQGQLGSDGGRRLDIAITPDHKTALISNFGDSAVFFVDVTNPISPSLITSVTLPFYAEDIDISADGKYALVTDGSFSPRVASINVPSATLVYTAELSTRYANAVVVAPDGTVIVADYVNRALHTLLLDEMGVVITNGNTYTNSYPGFAITDTAGLLRAVNLGLAPDGQTVIVCDATTSTVGIYRIVAPGVLTFAGVVAGLHGAFPEHETFSPGIQSVAFNAAGDKAYAVVNSMEDITGTLFGDRLAVLTITGPGQVSLEAGGAVTLPHRSSSQLFGADTLAVAGNKVYVGYPSLSGPDVTRPLAVVDLTNFGVTATMVLSKAVSTPTGVASIDPHRLFLPLVFNNHHP
jgi:hypothetical protein